MSTTFMMEMDEGQKILISQYVASHGQSMAEFMLGASLDQIEDAINLCEWRLGEDEFDENPLTYSDDEVMREFGLR